jgi:predicted nucleic acid-binding protein
MIFIDSNMWCYYFDQRLPEHKHVLEPIREIIRSEEIACNTTVIMEVAHYLVQHFNEETARKKITSLVNLRNLQVSDFDRSLIREASKAC